LSDGRIVSGSADRTVRVWRVDVGATRACNLLPVQLMCM
jgi:WD40 repeat protein